MMESQQTMEHHAAAEVEEAPEVEVDEETEPLLNAEDVEYLNPFNFGPSKRKLIGHMLQHLKIFLGTLSPPILLASFSAKYVVDKLVAGWANFLGKKAQVDILGLLLGAHWAVVSIFVEAINIHLGINKSTNYQNRTSPLI